MHSFFNIKRRRRNVPCAQTLQGTLHCHTSFLFSEKKVKGKMCIILDISEIIKLMHTLNVISLLSSAENVVTSQIKQLMSLLFILVMHIKIWKYWSALSYWKQANFVFFFLQTRAPPFAFHFLCFALRGRQRLKQILNKHNTNSILLHNPELLSEPPSHECPIPMFLGNNCCVLLFWFKFYI